MPISDASFASNQTEARYPWLKHYPKATRWDATFSPEPLHKLLEDAVHRFRPQPVHDVSRPHADLWRDRPNGRCRGARAAEARRQKGHQSRPVPAELPDLHRLLSSPSLKAGGTVVNYNPLYTLDELTFQVKDSETELMVTLDLKLLFDKVEALLKAGTPQARRSSCSFPALLPGAKSVLFKLFKAKELAHPIDVAGARQNIIAEADVHARTTASTRAGRDRPAERRRRAAIHRRHHRHAQGRHAHPRQRLHQRAAGRRLGARPGGTAKSACWARCRSSTCSP